MEVTVAEEKNFGPDSPSGAVFAAELWETM
jgi:hypothetical protein